MAQRGHIIIATIVSIAACAEEPARDPSLERDLEQATRASDTAPTVPATGQRRSTPNEAQSYAKRLRLTPNKTRLEELMAQMPREAGPEIGLVGRVRTYTWTFSDGSRLIARFTPMGGEGSGQGLVLRRIDPQ
jgi:hypothetical protein